MSLLVLSAGVGINAQAAVDNSARTLPVSTVDNMPNIDALSADNLQVQSTDRMGRLINKQRSQATQAPSVAADNMSVEELSRKDQQSDNTDDISDGQAVAGPNPASISTSSDPMAFELPDNEKR